MAEIPPKHHLAQPDSVAIAHVIYPALHTGRDFRKRDFPPAKRAHHVPQTALEVQRFAPFQAPVLRENDESQERNAFSNWLWLRAGMDRQAQAGEACYDLFFPLPE